MRSRRGFTLAEVTFALGITVLVGAGLAQFSLSTVRLLFDGTAKVEMASSVRTFTADISHAGRSARTFYVYPNYATGQAATDRVSDGGAGDFLVFLWIEPAIVDGERDYQITYYSRMVAYGRASGSAYAPVERFERTFPRSADFLTSAQSVEALIDFSFPTAAQPSREVVQLARGLTQQKLFANYRGTSVIVNGEILHGNKARNVTNTYNFTITPRG